MTRGDVHRVRLPGRRGRAQAGARHAVILQADELLGLSTAVVAPTSRSAADATFRPQVEIGDERARVLVEQLRAVDVRYLGERTGHLSADEQRAVDDALALVLALR